MDVFGGGHGVESLELLFFDVVVSGGDGDDDHDCDEDGGALQPALSQPFREDTQHQRNGCGSAEDSQHLVFKILGDLSGEGVTNSQMVLGGLTMGWLSP